MATEAERNRGAGAFSTPGVDTPAKAAAFESAAASPLVKFKFQGVEPPSNLYVTENDSIVGIISNSAVGMTVLVNTRILRRDGVIQYSQDAVVVPSNRARTVFTIKL